MNKNNIALDKSLRIKDKDGRLHVAKSHISKATVNPYYGCEIPNFEKLGLDAEKVYMLFRDPKELERAASSFARLPILAQHVQDLSADDNKKNLVIGSIGSIVEFNEPYLDADLSIWDAEYIEHIENGTMCNLSCGYYYTADMTAGEFEGEKYDGRMTNIVGNHLALVEVGRAGHDVVVADSKPFFKTEDLFMNMTKLGKRLFRATCALNPKIANDAALPALFANVTSQNFDKNIIKHKIKALDADIDLGALEEIIELVSSPNNEPVEDNNMFEAETEKEIAKDESPAEKIKSMLSGKVEADVIDAILALIEAPAVDNDVVKKDDMEKAIDSMKKSLAEKFQAEKEVRDVVGEVVGLDSAKDVYLYALKHLNVACDGVSDTNALRALFNLAQKKSQTKTIATDSGSNFKPETILNINRFN